MAQIELGFLMVGHTHEDIDQYFSCLSRYLRKHSAETLEGMTLLIHTLLYIDEPKSNDNIDVLCQIWSTVSRFLTDVWSKYRVLPMCMMSENGYVPIWMIYDIIHNHIFSCLNETLPLVDRKCSTTYSGKTRHTPNEERLT